MRSSSSTCRWCGNTVDFVASRKSGKVSPLQVPPPGVAPNVVIGPDGWYTVRPGEGYLISHFAVCPVPRPPRVRTRPKTPLQKLIESGG